MAGEEGGMVNDGAMFWVVDHLHWNELCAERKNIQVRLNRLILLQNLRGREWGREREREGKRGREEREGVREGREGGKRGREEREGREGGKRGEVNRFSAK